MREMALRMTGVAFLVLFAAQAGEAQTNTAAMAGVVKDAAGAVMPGVSVEASSAYLIEEVRTVVTDTEGQYKILDLPPSTFTVTFALPGFTLVRREGLQLNSGFTTQVNA